MIKKNKGQNGFTLLELLVYISILAIITLVVSNAFITFNQSRGQVEIRSEVNSNLRFAVNKIKTDILAASAIVTPASAGASANSLVLSAGADTITYSLSGGQLQRQLNLLPAENITSGNVTVDALSFLRLENNNTVLSAARVSLQMAITMSYASDSPDKKATTSKQTTISLSPDL